ncbi:MAG: 50S ribosomal protein L19 [Patescibacteria group bacterium]
MDQRILQFETKHRKKNPPDPKPGDTVRVHQLISEGGKERIQMFEGVVVARQHGKGVSGSFSVRKMGTDGIAIERTFPVHLPTVVKVERLRTAKGSRAKLYYLRTRATHSLKLKGEKRDATVWEEPMAEAELEKIKHEQEQAAKLKEAQEAAKQAELEKKFSQAKAQHDETTKPAGGDSGEPGDKTPGA